MDEVNTIVIGAGVIGLAIGARLARTRELMVLESEPQFGQGISSRNSEVIHAGIYYPKNSLKARLCVRGKELLYEYCADRHVAHRRTGKLIVATSKSELPELNDIRLKAESNGVTDLETLTASRIAEIEPQLSCVGGLLSPSTGIVSAHELMQSLDADIALADGQVVTHCHVVGVQYDDSRFVIEYQDKAEIRHLACQKLVIAAGLGSQGLARHLHYRQDYSVPRLHLCRGRYYSYQGPAPFSHLVYPVPEKNTAGLGTHATVDMAGQVKFGPDVSYINELDYSVPDEVPEAYFNAIAKYYPDVDKSRLVPGYAGIRPKIVGFGEPAADFRIDDVRVHGIPGLISLFGIESPGLTSALAIAETVEGIL